jgi:uncharacterized repeat protein (TIGR03803 family)
MLANGSKRSARGRASLGCAGLCAALALVLAGGAAAAPAESVLHAFTYGDGANPQAGLYRDSSGNLFGTASSGGAQGGGVVFKLAPDGTNYNVLHSFIYTDGAYPLANLAADGSGTLYGTAQQGGAGNGGVVFKLSPDGSNFAVLYSFCSQPDCGDGTLPQAGLFRDSSGNLYGTTANGGASGNGVVFKLAPDGTNFTVLHSFDGGSGGAHPYAGLIAGPTTGTCSPTTRTPCGPTIGTLVGTAEQGGTGNGVVFQLAQDGSGFKVLYSFCKLAGCADGAYPYGGLYADPVTGNLFGTAAQGGTHGNGVVFKLTPAGIETALHSFCSLPACLDGALPQAGLIADKAGNLYGTTLYGGTASQGVVFKVTPGGTESVLYSFTGPGGANPYAGLIADPTGNLLGTARNGGAPGYGTVFELTGAGFVTTVAFGAFSPNLCIINSTFFLNASFTLGSASNGINPPAEPVTLTVGTFTETIPAGSFVPTLGTFSFSGTPPGGAFSNVRIGPAGANQYTFQSFVEALPATVSPVPVTLTIGDDSGTTSTNIQSFCN